MKPVIRMVAVALVFLGVLSWGKPKAVKSSASSRQDRAISPVEIGPQDVLSGWVEAASLRNTIIEYVLAIKRTFPKTSNEHVRGQDAYADMCEVYDKFVESLDAPAQAVSAASVAETAVLRFLATARDLLGVRNLTGVEQVHLSEFAASLQQLKRNHRQDREGQFRILQRELVLNAWERIR